MATYEVLAVWERGGYFHVLIRLRAEGHSTDIRLRFDSRPSELDIALVAMAYVDEYEDHLLRSLNPLNQLETRILLPLREHTIDVFVFVVRGIINTPGVSLAQALAALVAEFPSTPFGDFRAFVTSVQTAFGGLTWDEFKTYVLEHAEYFDAGFLGQRPARKKPEVRSWPITS
jgi:hypothetical protein